MKPDAYSFLEDYDLAKLARLDRLAAEEVILRIRPRISRVIRIMVGNDRDCDDLLSNIYLQVLESIGRYKGTGTLEAWAGRIAFHIIVKYEQRRRMIEKVVVSCHQDLGIETSNPELEESRRYIRHKIVDALLRIPKVRRDTLVLRLAFGHSIREISELTRVPVNTVRGRLRTGLRELRQSMFTVRDYYVVR